MSGATPPLRALFAPAGDPALGGGHVMRCLTLAEALASRGVLCAFAVTAFGRILVERFSRSPMTLFEGDVHAALRQSSFNYLILDDYAVGAEQEQALKSSSQALIVLDDLADRAHTADLLVDPSYGRSANHYQRLTPPNCLRLLGQEYALLRPDFAKLRPAALARPVGREPQRLFLSFGLSDVGAVAARAATLIRRHAPGVPIDVALSSSAASAPVLRARARTDPGLTVHLDATGVAELMAASDLAIGAGGVSTWERCCLGRPTLAVIVADNQRAMIERLAKDGVILKADLSDQTFETSFLKALDRAWSLEVRQALTTLSAGLCDGLGAQRVADAVLTL